MPSRLWSENMVSQLEVSAKSISMEIYKKRSLGHSTRSVNSRNLLLGSQICMRPSTSSRRQTFSPTFNLAIYFTLPHGAPFATYSRTYLNKLMGRSLRVSSGSRRGHLLATIRKTSSAKQFRPAKQHFTTFLGQFATYSHPTRRWRTIPATPYAS